MTKPSIKKAAYHWAQSVPWFSGLNLKNIPAKVDTGADSSAIWATALPKKMEY